MSAHSVFMRLKPAVSRRTLEITLGVFWIIGGLVLIFRAGLMVHALSSYQWALIIAGLALGALKARFVLFRAAKRSIERIQRISPGNARLCFFAFISRTTYLLIVLMVTLGIALRSFYPHSVYVAAVYDGVGLALIVSGLYALQYVRRHVR